MTALGCAHSLLDGELAGATVAALSLVDTPIGTTADEADDFIALGHALLVVVAGEHGIRTISRASVGIGADRLSA